MEHIAPYLLGPIMARKLLGVRRHLRAKVLCRLIPRLVGLGRKTAEDVVEDIGRGGHGYRIIGGRLSLCGSEPLLLQGAVVLPSRLSMRGPRCPDIYELWIK